VNLGTAMNLANGAGLLWILLAGVFSVGVTTLWLYIGWRAMKAHERLARAAEQMVHVSPRSPSSPPL